MKIILKPTDRKDTLNLEEFYREPSDAPGTGKLYLRSILQSLPSHVKYITLYASGGTDEKNMRSRWTKWFIKDKRSFGTWTFSQIKKWLSDHNVSPEFSLFILSEKITRARKWLRILSTNESLVKYYTKLGFKSIHKTLSTSVQMKGSVKKIITHCK